MAKNSGEKLTFKEKIVSLFHPQGIEVEMLRYRPNKTSYKFALLAIVLFALAFCINYSGTNISGQHPEFSFLGYSNLGFWSFVDLLLNILLLLLFLTCAMEIEAYSIKFSIYAIVGGVWQIGRSFGFQLSMFNVQLMDTGIFVSVLICYVLSGVCLIIAGAIGIVRGRTLREYLSTVAPLQNERVKTNGKR